ncbi:MAG: hypothetical protein HQL05_09755 [Nitrospirae bacterium]|uniref:hypothetical protein n=1 Tax=Candidatus Magnetobacterium casense TaxID=1455061 RepID=UPI00058B5B90|nr:hypothetical protein [Candidatus Magnetobacterium casensis]MBF0338104.1 hypothetical protein [Nitrospirota bacterium]
MFQCFNYLRRQERPTAKAGLLTLALIVVIAAMCLGSLAVDASADDYVFVTKWGSQGTGDGQFNRPRGVVTDSAGNVYVADLNNNRIQKFAPSSSGGPYKLTINKSGTGSGTVTSSPSGINCGMTCSASYNTGMSVILTAAADGVST